MVQTIYITNAIEPSFFTHIMCILIYDVSGNEPKIFIYIFYTAVQSNTINISLYT